MRNSTKANITPAITLDLRITSLSDAPVRAFIKGKENKVVNGDTLKINFTVTEKDFSKSGLSSFLEAFEMQVNVRLPV
jgi:hypothetical protein